LDPLSPDPEQLTLLCDHSDEMAEEDEIPQTIMATRGMRR
jgi:hypothetical protein